MISGFCFIAIRPPESAGNALLVSAESALSAAFLLVAGSGRSNSRLEKGIAVLKSDCWSVTALGGKRQRHRVCACDVMLCLDMVLPPEKSKLPHCTNGKRRNEPFVRKRAAKPLAFQQIEARGEWDRLAKVREQARRNFAREGTENAETMTVGLRIASALRHISLARPGTGNGICRSLASSAGASWVRFATSGNIREIMSALRDSSELLIPFSTGSRPWQHDYAGPSGLWRQHSKRNHNRQTNSPIRQPAGNPQLPASSVRRLPAHSSESPPQTGQSTRRENRPCPRGRRRPPREQRKPRQGPSLFDNRISTTRGARSSSRSVPRALVILPDPVGSGASGWNAAMLRRREPRGQPGRIRTLVTIH